MTYVRSDDEVGCAGSVEGAGYGLLLNDGNVKHALPFSPRVYVACLRGTAQMPWCLSSTVPSHLGSEQADEAQPRAELARRSACRNRCHVCGHVLSQQVRRRPQHSARQVIVSCARRTAVGWA